MRRNTKTRELPRTTTQRLMHDIYELRDDNLSSHGIYYRPNEENILKGYALIVGSSGTPYLGGYYFFEFDFPTNFPFAPPIVTYKTNQHAIRFHPNLYTNGRVCLSIINTWMGSQWSACQTISSVLLVLASLLCENPLLNEPCVDHTNIQLQKDYATTVLFSNINIAMCNVIQKTPGLYQPFFNMFDDIVLQKWREHFEDVRAICVARLEEFGEEDIEVPHYYNNMKVRLNYRRLLDKLDATNQCVCEEEITRGIHKRKDSVADNP